MRYIGIDTPETVDPRTTVECFGREAAAKNRELVEGREVLLEQDVSERDRFDRLLRYVWVRGDDGITRHVNEELVKWGFAASSAYPPDVRYQGLLDAAEREARDNSRGLWAVCEGPHQPLPAPPPPPPPPAPAPPPPAPPPAPRPAPPAPLPPPPPPPAAPAPAPPPGGRCDPSYPTVCIPPPPPDLDCGEVPYRRFQVRPPDPHRFDGDSDGIGCE